MQSRTKKQREKKEVQTNISLLGFLTVHAEGDFNRSGKIKWVSSVVNDCCRLCCLGVEHLTYHDSHEIVIQQQS